jgi:uncharacterized protein (TIGR02996 family)
MMESFLSAIRADPDSDTPRLVFADWLEERDDPRSDMLRLSCGFAAEKHNSPQRDALETQLEAWQDAWLEPWLGPLTDQVRIERGLFLLFPNDECPFDYYRKLVGPDLCGWVWGLQCNPVDDRTVTDLTAWPRLPSLYLSGARQLTDAGARQLARMTCLQFLGLDIDNGVLTPAGLEPLARLDNLRTLVLMGDVDGFSDGLDRLAAIPNLEDLVLWMTWPGKKRFSPVGKLPRLRSLTLSGCDGLPDEALSVLSRASRLEELNLYRCLSLTGSGLADVAGLPALRSLNLSLCRKIKNADVAHLARATGLERLHVEDCARLTDKCLEAIGKLTRLRELNVSECPAIRGKGLASLTGLERLEHLKLSGCRELTDASIVPLGQLRELRILRLRQCRHLTAKGLIAALGGLTHLRWLDLRECPQLSSADRKRLVKTWPECQVTF